MLLYNTAHVFEFKKKKKPHKIFYILVDNQIKVSYNGIQRNRLLRDGIVEEAFKDQVII